MYQKLTVYNEPSIVWDLWFSSWIVEYSHYVNKLKSNLLHTLMKYISLRIFDIVFTFLEWLIYIYLYVIYMSVCMCVPTTKWCCTNIIVFVRSFVCLCMGVEPLLVLQGITSRVINKTWWEQVILKLRSNRYVSYSISIYTSIHFERFCVAMYFSFCVTYYCGERILKISHIYTYMP